jgi:tetratricopeptide (TPR) repeat protein
VVRGPGRVFLSHTSELRDFPRDRSYIAAAEAAIMRAEGVVTDMAYFTARDSQPADYCRRMVAAADVYVGVIGFKYGSPVRDRPDVSYVELEFETATQRHLPRLIFLLDEEAVSLPASRIIDHDRGVRQSALRRSFRDEAGLTTATVASPADLEARLFQALLELAQVGAEPAPAGSAAQVGGPVGIPLGRQPAEVRGREDLLCELMEERGLVVLAATGGMGKSTVAVELTQRVPAGWPRWWVSAADASSLTAGMVTVARQVGASEADLRALAAQAGDAPDRFWALLERAPEGWLLVLDNADQPELLAARGATVADGTGWTQASRHGMVLITSRYADQATWGRQARVHRLQPLPEKEAARVLLDLAPHAGDPAQAAALARRLGGLPLALHLCGSYLGADFTRLVSFADYLKALDGEVGGVGLLSPDPGSPRAGDPRATVMRTWELSLDDLANQGLPHARALLRLLSCFAPGAPIPIDVLDPASLAGMLGAPWEGRTPGPGSAAVQLEQALRGLIRLGLIDTVAGQPIVLVQHLIADTNRAHLRQAGPDPIASLIWRTAVRIMAQAVDSLNWRQPRDWPRLRGLTPHVRALFDVWGPEHAVEDLVLLLQASRWLINANHLAGALLPAADLTQAALAHAMGLGGTHPTILAFRQHLAYQARERGHWAAAETGFREVLVLREGVLGHDHPDTLDTRFHLAWIMARQGRHADAEAEFREVLEARRRKLGDDHHDVLDTRHELARTITARGRWMEAEGHFRAVLDARVRVLGAEDPDTMVTRHYLARHRARLARWEATEDRLLKLLDARSRALGHSHSDLAAAIDDQDDPVVRQARWSDAESAFRDLLEAQERVLGANHPETLATSLQLARLAATEGRWTAAVIALRAVLEAQVGVFSEDHPNILATREYLAWVDGNQGLWEAAESALRDCHEARRTVHGDEHPYTLATAQVVAQTLAGQERWADAEAAFRRLLDARRRVLGEGHPDTLVTHVELARAMAKQGRWEEVEVARQLHRVTRGLVFGDREPSQP